jgi:NAD(P)-dependent dehydrogenase (short-subunit alcohol dehydrogenase family)
LITGGSSGIGLAVARALGQDGYGVTVSARRADKLEQAAARLRDEGLDVLAVTANMAAEDDIKRMVGAHQERFGRMDLLMNNAGVGIGGAIAEAETKKLDMQIDVNLRAVYLTTRESIPMLKVAGADGGAMIVNTASIAGKRPQGWLAAYSATKAGVIALTEATAKELAADGVRCTAICPGFVDTPMTEWIKGEVPPAEMIQPEDVAEIVRCVLRLSPACIVPEVMMVRPAELTGP